MSDHTPEFFQSAAKRISTEVLAIRKAFRTGLAHANTAGELLAQVKEVAAEMRKRKEVPYGGGSFNTWIRPNCGISERTADLYIRIHRNWSRITTAAADRLDELTLNDAAALLVEKKRPTANKGTTKVVAAAPVTSNAPATAADATATATSNPLPVAGDTPKEEPEPIREIEPGVNPLTEIPPPQPITVDELDKTVRAFVTKPITQLATPAIAKQLDAIIGSLTTTRDQIRHEMNRQAEGTKQPAAGPWIRSPEATLIAPPQINLPPHQDAPVITGDMRDSEPDPTNPTANGRRGVLFLLQTSAAQPFQNHSPDFSPPSSRDFPVTDEV